VLLFETEKQLIVFGVYSSCKIIFRVSCLIFFGYWGLFPGGTFGSDFCKAEDIFDF
jgi:hypothetical protein